MLITVEGDNLGIKIGIVAGHDGSISSVKAEGKIQHVITPEERATFKISDDALKACIFGYFGFPPGNVYLNGPTPPYGDMYAGYNWTPVQTVLQVESAEILGITSTPEIVKTQEFVNNSAKKGTFHVSIKEDVSNTVASTWSTGGTLSVGSNIEVSCEFLGVGAKGSVSLSYSQSWGIGGEESKSVTVGSDSGVDVELDPGESVLAELSASRGSMKVRIRYNAALWGYVAMHYDALWKEHHDWALSIGSLMNAQMWGQKATWWSTLGLPMSVKSVQDIEIGYYSNSKVELKSPKTRELVADLAAFGLDSLSKSGLHRVVNLSKPLAGD